MAILREVKSYPLLRGAIILSAILLLVGIFVTGIVTDPDDADIPLFVALVVVAGILPFLALTWRRHETILYELPSDRLAGVPRRDLEGMLEALESAKARGDLPEGRYARARERIMAAMAKQ
jgi:hypothetical protein